MDLAKSLGVERKQGKPEVVCGYDLWCPECGYKSARVGVSDVAAGNHVKGVMERQYRELTFPAHAEHGAFTIIKEYNYPYELSEHNK